MRETSGLSGSGSSVVVIEPEQMNLLGLMLASLLDRRSREPAMMRHARALQGDVLVEASGMQVTLRFEAGKIEVSRGAPQRACAEIRGTLRALLGAALGRDRLRSMVKGQLSARGRPRALWHVLALVRA